jgi:hypothetical protein
MLIVPSVGFGKNCAICIHSAFRNIPKKKSMDEKIRGVAFDAKIRTHRSDIWARQYRIV